MTSPAADYVAALLRARVVVGEARRMKYRPAMGATDGITPSPRLISVLSGAMRYRIESRTYRIAAPAMLFVPPHARRCWDAEVRTTVVFFHYDTNPVIPTPPPMRLTGAPAHAEDKSMHRILSLAPAVTCEAQLLIEAEAKAVLTRVLLAAEPLDKTRSGVARNGQIESALQWMRQNYAQPDPLANLHEHAGLSEAYFRSQFRRLVGKSPRTHLNTLRMQAARFLLVETTSPVKQIAREVGFADPLYFSRCYHAFWKKWPTDERDA